jgi:hypothetical protein
VGDFPAQSVENPPSDKNMATILHVGSKRRLDDCCDEDAPLTELQKLYGSNKRLREELKKVANRELAEKVKAAQLQAKLAEACEFIRYVSHMNTCFRHLTCCIDSDLREQIILLHEVMETMNTLSEEGLRHCESLESAGFIDTQTTEESEGPSILGEHATSQAQSSLTNDH